MADFAFVASSFGGGWLVPLNEAAESYMDEPPEPIAPLGGREGWVLEPQDAGDLLVAAVNAGWTITDKWEAGDD